MRSQPCLVLMACFLAAALGGCSYAPRETRAAYEPVTDATTTAKPLALLPAEGGAIVSVLESRASGIYTQRIIFTGDAATDGENAVIVQIDQNERRVADLSVLPKPTEESIGRELDATFPSIAMQISRAWSHNEFGPFGYAVGKASADVTCIYAWQFTQGAAPRLLDDPQARSAAASMPSSPMSIRVRLCRQGRSEAELVSLVRAMQVYPLDGGAPYHDTLYAGIGPLGAGDALQAAGAPGQFFLRPMTPPTDIRHRPTKPRQHAVRRHMRPARAVSLGLPPVSRAASGIVVPLPAGPPAVATGPANPLLAPLQQQAPPPVRSAGPADEMPLPGAAAPNPGAPAAIRSGSAIPLPD